MRVPGQARHGDTIGDGIIAGILGGWGWIVTQMAIARWFGSPLVGPWRLISSLLLGPAALSPVYPLISVLVVGAGIHLIVSSFYGVVAFVLLDRAGQRSASPMRLILFGAAIGALAWAVDFLLIGGLFFPELQATDQILNGVLAHVVGFGAVVGMYALVTRPGGSAASRSPR